MNEKEDHGFLSTPIMHVDVRSSGALGGEDGAIEFPLRCNSE